MLSIGLPVYNGERYLQQCLDSILAQDYEDYELIVSDNGSTDGTAEICVTYARKNARIRYFRSDSNRGATWNFRRVLELAQGRYFKWAPHDDVLLPAMFRRCMEVMERSGPAVSFVYPRSEFIDGEGRVIMQRMSVKWDRVGTSAEKPHQRLARALYQNLYGEAIYGIARTNLLRHAVPFGSLAPDWVKVAELAMLGTIVEVPEILMRVRIHEGASVYANPNRRQLLTWFDPASRGRAILLPRGPGS